MKTSQTSYYPPVPSGGTFTLPQRNKAYRLFGIRVTITVELAGAATTPSLFILDGAGQTIMEFPGIEIPTNSTSVIQWIAGSNTLSQLGMILAGTPQPVQNLWIPDQLWVQPTWDVIITETIQGATGVFGPIITIIDEYAE